SRHVRAVDSGHQRGARLAADRAGVRRSVAGAAEVTIGETLRPREADFRTALKRMFAFRPTDRVGIGPQGRAVDVRIWTGAPIPNLLVESKIDRSRGLSGD